MLSSKKTIRRFCGFCDCWATYVRVLGWFRHFRKSFCNFKLWLHSSQERQLRALLIGELKAAIKLRPQLNLHVDLIGEGPHSVGRSFCCKVKGTNFFHSCAGINFFVLMIVSIRIMLLVYILPMYSLDQFLTLFRLVVVSCRRSCCVWNGTLFIVAKYFFSLLNDIVWHILHFFLFNSPLSLGHTIATLSNNTNLQCWKTNGLYSSNSSRLLF